MKNTSKRLTPVLLALVIIMTYVSSVLSTLPAKAYGEEYNVTVDTSQRSFRWPVPDCTGISSCFEDGRNHGAIDITAPKGTAIYAAASGTVKLVKTGCSHNYPEPCSCNGGGGNYLVLEHGIAGKTYWTCYMHCTDIYVSTGDWVNSGSQIATIGSTGSSYGYHCDFSIRTGSSWTDRRLDPGYYTQLPSVLRYTGSSPGCCLPYLQDIASNPGVILEMPFSDPYNPSEEKTPSKPIVTVTSSDELHPVIVSYNACSDATNYDIRFYNANTDELIYGIGCFQEAVNFGTIVEYTDTSYSHSFQAGSYYVTVAAVNNKKATNWWNYSDKVYFTVSAAIPKEYKINFVVDGEVIESRTVLDGASVGDMPNAPKKEGYAFKEWVEDEGRQTDEVHSNLSFTAVYDPRIIGDVSLDFNVDASDAKLLAKYLSCNVALSDEQLKLADFNSDSKINAVDLTLLKRKILIDESIIITMNKSSVMLNTVGTSKTFQLQTSYINPDDVVWKSSNPSVCTVKNGLVTAQKDGTVTISATANGVTVSCKVTVKTAYTDTWSDWSDWSTTPIFPSDSIDVKKEERSSLVLVSYNIEYYCTRRKDNKKRQFRNYSINVADHPELDQGYGQNTTQTAFGVPYLVKTVDELNAVAKIQPGEWSTGSQAGQNCADVVGYSFDGCIFYILGENYDTVSTTYYSSRQLVKTPVVYDNE